MWRLLLSSVSILTIAVVIAAVTATPARGDVELPPEEEPAEPAESAEQQPPPAPDRPLDLYGSYEGEPGGGEGEELDGPPPGIDTFPVFQGSRAGPYPLFGVDAELLYAELRGDYEYESGGGRGDEISVRDDLPIDASRPSVRLTGWIMLSRSWTLTGSYLRGRYEGRGAAERSFVHDAVLFEAGDHIDSTVTVELVWAGARYLAVNDGDFKIGVPFGVLWARERVDIDNETTGGSARASIDSWSPYVGLYIDAHFGYGFGIEAEGRIFAWGQDDEEFFGYAEGSASLYMTLFDHMRLFVGVRGLAVDYLDEGRDDRSFEVRLAGVLTGVSLYF